MASFFQAFFSSQCVRLTTEALFASDFFIAKNVCVMGKCHVVFTSDLFWGNVLISCWARRHTAVCSFRKKNEKNIEFGSVASRQKVTMKKLNVDKLELRKIDQKSQRFQSTFGFKNAWLCIIDRWAGIEIAKQNKSSFQISYLQI